MFFIILCQCFNLQTILTIFLIQVSGIYSSNTHIIELFKQKNMWKQLQMSLTITQLEVSSIIIYLLLISHGQLMLINNIECFNTWWLKTNWSKGGSITINWCRSLLQFYDIDLHNECRNHVYIYNFFRVFVSLVLCNLKWTISSISKYSWLLNFFSHNH
jgi:hypothetical protein